jgi:hypothetical protein
MRVETKTDLPEHKVVIRYHMDTQDFTVWCSVCGYLGRPKKTWAQAMNRKSTHERGQDAGAD